MDNVVFRMIKGEVTAFIFDEMPMLDGNINSYAHIGQHSEASYGYYKSGRLATEAEYTPLKQELESIGYNVKVSKRKPVK